MKVLFLNTKSLQGDTSGVQIVVKTQAALESHLFPWAMSQLLQVGPSWQIQEQGFVLSSSRCK